MDKYIYLSKLFCPFLSVFVVYLSFICRLFVVYSSASIQPILISSHFVSDMPPRRKKSAPPPPPSPSPSPPTVSSVERRGRPRDPEELRSDEAKRRASQREKLSKEEKDAKKLRAKEQAKARYKPINTYDPEDYLLKQARNKALDYVKKPLCRE